MSRDPLRPLQDQKALVTGGSSGIGAGISRVLAAAGAAVGVNYRTHRERAEEITAETDDGLPPGEGAFLACSFWLVDNLVLQGRRDEARSMFERLLDLRNDVGLLAEEYDPQARRQVGNFPQAFSHLVLADSARNLSSAEKPAIQRIRERAEARTG